MARNQLKQSTIAWGSFTLGALALALPSAVAWWRRDQLPEQVAVHWGADGVADGFQELGPALLTSGLIGLAVMGLLVGVGAATRTLGLIGPLTVGMGVFLAVLMPGTILAQAGGGSVAVGAFLVGALVAGAVVTLAGMVWLRGHLPPVPADETGTFQPALPGHPDIDTWTGRTRVGAAPVVLAVGLAAAGIALAVVLGDIWVSALTLTLSALGAVLILASYQRVTVDSTGVSARFMGVRVKHIPLDRIVSAGHVRIEALGEYGGYGLRAGHDGKREGLITSSGEALIVQRVGEKDYVITVDGAPEAARVLAMHVANRPNSPGP